MPIAPCVIVLAREDDALRPILVALLSAFAAFLTGMSVAVVPRWFERRHQSRELAMAWVGEYLTRLHHFTKDGGTDADPLPLPLLSRQHTSRLSAIAISAGSILTGAVYLKALNESERRQLVAPIVAQLRGYPSAAAGGAA